MIWDSQFTHGQTQFAVPDTIKGLYIINESEIDLSVEFTGLF